MTQMAQKLQSKTNSGKHLHFVVLHFASACKLSVPCEYLLYTMTQWLTGGLLQSWVGPSVVILFPWCHFLVFQVSTNLGASFHLLEIHTVPLVVWVQLFPLPMGKYG